MADLGKPSKFAVLRDEGSRRVKKAGNTTSKTTDTKEKQENKKAVTTKGKSGTENQRKGGKENVVKEVAKVLPVGLTLKSVKKLTKTAKNEQGNQNKAKSQSQAAELKKKYEEAEAREFAKNLEQAILESKLNFEENEKETVKDADAVANKKRRKKAKPKAQEPVANSINSNVTNGKISTTSIEDEVAEEPFVTKKEKKQKKVTKPKVSERDTTDVRLLQCRAELEEKDVQIAKLVSEANQMKEREEIGNLKKVNKKLCSILEKVKDKVDSIVMVDELIKVKDELTQEVTNLHVSLEQERSKVHSLQLQLRAQGNRKDSK